MAAAAFAQTTLPLDFEYDKNEDRKRFDEACAKFFSPEESEHLFKFVTPPRRQRFLRKEYKKLIKVVDNNRKLMEKGLPKDVDANNFNFSDNAQNLPNLNFFNQNRHTFLLFVQQIFTKNLKFQFVRGRSDRVCGGE